MKIYDEQRFRESISGFILGIVFLGLYIRDNGGIDSNFPYFCIPMVVLGGKNIIISLSEEKRREAREREELLSIARLTAFGSFSWLMEWGALILLLSMFAANRSILLSFVLLVAALIYMFWYRHEIEKAVRELQTDTKTTEN